MNASVAWHNNLSARPRRSTIVGSPLGAAYDLVVSIFIIGVAFAARTRAVEGTLAASAAPDVARVLLFGASIEASVGAGMGRVTAAVAVAAGFAGVDVDVAAGTGTGAGGTVALSDTDAKDRLLLSDTAVVSGGITILFAKEKKDSLFGVAT